MLRKLLLQERLEVKTAEKEDKVNTFYYYFCFRKYSPFYFFLVSRTSQESVWRTLWQPCRNRIWTVQLMCNNFKYSYPSLQKNVCWGGWRWRHTIKYILENFQGSDSQGEYCENCFKGTVEWDLDGLKVMLLDRSILGEEPLVFFKF
jgi:hypothetical protein